MTEIQSNLLVAALREASRALTELDPEAEHHNAVLIDDALCNVNLDRVVWACPRCKSQRVQSQMWVRSNTEEVLDDTERYGWCDACDEDGNDGEIHYGSMLEIPVSQIREGK